MIINCGKRRLVSYAYGWRIEIEKEREKGDHRMSEFILPHGKRELLGFIDKLQTGFQYVVTVKRYQRKRSNEQNSLSHAWYTEIAAFMGESPDYARRYCKLTYGVPILRADSAEYDAFCQKALDPYSYADQLVNMKFTPVTRLMNKGQMRQFIETVQFEFGQQGLALEAA